MGIFRTALALCVLAEHARGSLFGIRPLPGFLAVQAFYIMSGFYMALVLSEKYIGSDRLRRFYSARAKRLFPLYWLALAATLIFSIALPPLEEIRLQIWTNDIVPIWLRLIAAFSNVTFVGLDWIRLAPAQPGPYLGFLIVVPQSWTIGLEVMFYLLAPFLNVLRTRWLVAFMIASLAARHIGYHFGFGRGVWTNGFFPFEIALFLAGMLGYRIARQIAGANFINPTVCRWIGGASCAILIGIALFALTMKPPVVDGYGPIRNWLFLAALSGALPFIFLAFENSAADRLIGEYSYPIYILHFLFIAILTATVPQFVFDKHIEFGTVVALLTVITATIYIRRFQPLVLSAGLGWASTQSMPTRSM